jgi:UDP-N-acetylmuramate-alanine ligase
MGYLIMKLLRHDTFVESNLVLDYLQHPVADISLQIPGVHNVLNSLAVSEIFLLSLKKKIFMFKSSSFSLYFIGL